MVLKSLSILEKTGCNQNQAPILSSDQGFARAAIFVHEYINLLVDEAMSTG